MSSVAIEEWFFAVVFMVLAFRVCIAFDANCDFHYKVQPGQAIGLSNYGGKGNGLMTNCRWRIFSDTGVKLTCDNAYLTQALWGCSFRFYIYPNDGGRSTPYNNCGESGSYESDVNFMVVTLTGPPNIPEGTFNCKFEATNTCRCGWKNPTKIIGGEHTGVNEYPMMAGIVYKKNFMAPPIDKENLICGATIISSQYVVTAAHCLLNMQNKELGVLIGDHNINSNVDTTAAKLYGVDQTIPHTYFNDTNKHNDIALVKIMGSIEYTNLVGPACLPFNRYYYTFEGQAVDILGWGHAHFGGGTVSALRKATVQVSNFAQCKSSNVSPMLDSQICTYTPGKDACQFDSGGPVMWKDPTNNGLFIVGIISYGKGCAEPLPSYNTRVSSFIDWIKKNSDSVYCVV